MLNAHTIILLNNYSLLVEGALTLLSAMTFTILR